MKIRQGFVSNSSSSSFVLGKNFMTPEQIKKFSNKLDEINEVNYGEGYIFESEYYFHGEVSDHNTLLDEILGEMGLLKYSSFEC